jgi:hypothetical protein
MVVFLIRSIIHSWLTTGFEMRIKGRVSHVEMRLLFQIIRNRPQFEWGWCCSIYSLLSGVWYIIACSFSFWSFHFLSDLQFLITPFGIFKLFILLWQYDYFVVKLRLILWLFMLLMQCIFLIEMLWPKNAKTFQRVYNVRLRNVFGEIASITSSFCTHNR